MTKERAKELLPLINAYVEGKIIQFKDLNNEWVDLPDPNFDDNRINSYRIKHEPKYRPWTFEEAPLNVMFASKNTETKLRFAFYLVNPSGYKDFPGSIFTFEEMLKDFLYSSDNGKTWLPCGTLI
jgi:hypothetical protein